MKITLKRVDAGDPIIRALSLHSVVNGVAPEDGIVIQFGHIPSFFLGWSFLKKFWGSGKTTVEVNFDS